MRVTLKLVRILFHVASVLLCATLLSCRSTDSATTTTTTTAISLTPAATEPARASLERDMIADLAGANRTETRRTLMRLGKGWSSQVRLSKNATVCFSAEARDELVSRIRSLPEAESIRRMNTIGTDLFSAGKCLTFLMPESQMIDAFVASMTEDPTAEAQSPGEVQVNITGFFDANSQNGYPYADGVFFTHTCLVGRLQK